MQSADRRSMKSTDSDFSVFSSKASNFRYEVTQANPREDSILQPRNLAHIF
jgi:hypothetical protein